MTILNSPKMSPEKHMNFMGKSMVSGWGFLQKKTSALGTYLNHMPVELDLREVVAEENNPNTPDTKGL